MVEQSFIAKIENVLDLLTNRYGEVRLFALFKMDEITDKWSLILSADWINDENRNEVFNFIVSSLQETLTHDELLLLARIGIFTPDEHLVELILETYRTGDRILQDEKINGNLIHEGIMLRVNSDR